jgi:hypothetical protein
MTPNKFNLEKNTKQYTEIECGVTLTHAPQIVDICNMTPYSLVDDYHYFFAGRGEVPTPLSEQITSHNLTSEKLSSVKPLK